MNHQHTPTLLTLHCIFTKSFSSEFITLNISVITMSFNFFIESSPDEDLKIDNEELQEFVGGMLESILAQGIKEGSIITKDIQDNGK